ncbi:hypothetical protein BaRGS_00026779, partial [Batillaria attramentaria]
MLLPGRETSLIGDLTSRLKVTPSGDGFNGVGELTQYVYGGRTPDKQVQISQRCSISFPSHVCALCSKTQSSLVGSTDSRRCLSESLV